MRRCRRVAPATVLVAAAVTLPACGSDDGTIPQDKADPMLAALADLEDALGQGQCANVEAAAARFREGAVALPAEVDREVKEALLAGSDQLLRLAADPQQCEPSGATGGQGELPTVTAPPTQPTATAPQTETTPEQPAGEGDVGESGPGGGGQGQDGSGGGNDDGSGGTGAEKGKRANGRQRGEGRAGG